MHRQNFYETHSHYITFMWAWVKLFVCVAAFIWDDYQSALKSLVITSFSILHAPLRHSKILHIATSMVNVSVWLMSIFFIFAIIYLQPVQRLNASYSVISPNTATGDTVLDTRRELIDMKHHSHVAGFR